MAELTLVSCPTCGLPAEVLWMFRKDLGHGFVEHARTRCVVLHTGVVQMTEPTAAQRRAARRAARRAQKAEARATADVAAPVLARTVRQIARAAAMPVLWAVFGAVTTLLFTISPPLGLVMIPAAIPVAGFVAARRHLRPLRELVSVQVPVQEEALEMQDHESRAEGEDHHGLQAA